MKIRNGFVSNSSSSSFLIQNTSDNLKTLEDFVKENKNLLDEFKTRYCYTDRKEYTLKNMIRGAEKLCVIFHPKEEKVLSFGDGHGTIIGHVYDYILRDGGYSKSFTWECIECRGEQK